MLIGAIIIFITLFLDQVTKYVAKAVIPGIITPQNPNITWIPNLLELSYYENTGASGGILKDAQLLFMIVTIIALVVFGYFFLQSDFKHKKTYSWAIALFIGGTLGNAIDRALLGYVIDFLHYPFLGPILNVFGLSNFYNNLADMFLSAAIVLFAIDLFFFEPKRLKEAKKHEQNPT
jgi:signal peptidase II